MTPDVPGPTPAKAIGDKPSPNPFMDELSIYDYCPPARDMIAAVQLIPDPLKGKEACSSVGRGKP